MSVGPTVNMARAVVGLAAIGSAIAALACAAAFAIGNFGTMPDALLALSLRLAAWAGLAAAIFSICLIALAIVSPAAGARRAPWSIAIGALACLVGITVAIAACVVLSAMDGMALKG